jgi:hypothetical protein
VNASRRAGTVSSTITKASVIVCNPGTQVIRQPNGSIRGACCYRTGGLRPFELAGRRSARSGRPVDHVAPLVGWVHAMTFLSVRLRATTCEPANG